MYLQEKMLNKLYNDGYTLFLNPHELEEITNRLKKNSYNLFKPYLDSEKNIVYFNIPNIILFEIKSPIMLKHSDILGSLYSLKIDDHLFGDIIIKNNHYYFYTFKYLQAFFEMELTKISNANIELIEQNIDLLKDFHLNFKEIKIITKSLRIDSIIAKIIHTNRDEIKNLIQDKKIIYNYDLLKDTKKMIKINDTFSIRKHGKYKFYKIEGNTKKDNLVLIIHQYIAN